MKILGTIVLSLIAIVASLVLVVSSMCAYSGGFSGNNSERGSYLLIAIVALAVVIGTMTGIAKLNRKRDS